MAKKTDKCIECGKPLNEGEAKTFTCCDDCWQIAYASKPQSAQSEGMYPVTPCPSGGFFCSGSYFDHRHDAEHQSEKMKEAYAQGQSSMRAEYEQAFEDGAKFKAEELKSTVSDYLKVCADLAKANERWEKLKKIVYDKMWGEQKFYEVKNIMQNIELDKS